VYLKTIVNVLQNILDTDRNTGRYICLREYTEIAIQNNLKSSVYLRIFFAVDCEIIKESKKHTRGYENDSSILQ
jgi:hypothetical protein